MTKRIRRLLSVFLALMLCVSLFPAAAFAEGDEGGSPIGQETPTVPEEVLEEEEAPAQDESRLDEEDAREDAEPEEDLSALPPDGEIEAVTSGTCGDELTWNLEGGVLTVSGVGDMSDYSYYTAPWYGERVNIRQVNLAEGVTGVGDYAFYGCSALTQITIPAGLTRIGASAFYGTALGTLELPESVVSVGEFAFYNCSSLTSIALPSGLTEIGKDLFYGCTALSVVAIPENVTSIGAMAFYNCSSLQRITIPAEVTSIGKSAFSGTGLTEIRFEGNAPEIGEQCFLNVTATAYYPTDYSGWTDATRQGYGGTLTWESVGAGLIYVASGTCGENLFWAFDTKGTLTVCGTGEMTEFGSTTADSSGGVSIRIGAVPWKDYRDQITKLVIEPGAVSIGHSAFYSCKALTSVSLPETLTRIGDFAFDLCNQLPELVLPDGVETLGREAFGSCSSLRTVLLPEGLTSIGYGAFSSCTGLTSVTISEGVTSIGSRAFSSCTGLTSITIPASVTSIGSYAFSFCTGLTSVTISEGVTDIGSDAFSSCTRLTRVTIPASVTNIGYGAFSFCSGLTAFYVNTANPAYCEIGGVLLTRDRTKLLAYPSGKTAVSYTVPDGVTEVGSYAFYGNKTLTELSFPGTLNSIGKFAFSGRSTKFNQITFRGTVEQWSEVEIYGGNDCVTDTLIRCTDGDLPYDASLCGARLHWSKAEDGTLTISGMGRMWDYTVRNGSSFYPYHSTRSIPWGSEVSKLVLEEGVTYLGTAAFSDVPSDRVLFFTELSIPSTVTEIGPYCFRQCVSLEQIALPEGLQTLGHHVFYGCSGLTGITIPASVTKIGEGAFQASGLTEIRFEGSAPSLEGPGNGYPPDAVFEGVTATAYYPGYDASWTEEVRQSFGGTVTWVPYMDSCTVSFDANGGIGAPDAVEQDRGSELILPTTAPTREGYRFLGWAQDPDAEEPVWQPGDTLTVDGSMTLYAVWEEMPEPEVLTFHFTDASSRPNETFTVVLKCANNPGLRGISAQLVYDENVLVLEAASPKFEIGSWSDTILGDHLVYWYSNSNTEVFTGEDVIELRFRVAEDAPEGEFEIGLQVGAWDGFYDVQGDDVAAYRLEAGHVTVTHRIPGDINGDRKVNLSDVIRLSDYVKARGVGVEIIPGSSDVNGDGRENLSDVIRLADYVKARGVGVEIH